jgi:hypothetical protein
LGEEIMKYYCATCGAFIKKPVEYTGNEIEDPNLKGVKVKEIRQNIIFVPVKIKYQRKKKSDAEVVFTKLYHSPCIEQYKGETQYQLPVGQAEVVLVD